MKLVWKARGGGRLIHSPDFGYFLVPVRAETLTNMNTFLNCILAHPSPVPAGFRKCARRKKIYILSKTFFPSPPAPHPLKSPQDTVNTVNREPWLLFLGIYQVFRITFSVPLIEPRVRRVYGARRYVYDMRSGSRSGAMGTSKWSWQAASSHLDFTLTCLQSTDCKARTDDRYHKHMLSCVVYVLLSH